MKKISLVLAFVLLASSFGLSAIAAKRSFPLGEFDVAPDTLEIYDLAMITTGRLIIEPERVNKDWTGNVEVRDLDGEVLCSGELNGGQFKICPLVRGEYQITMRNDLESTTNARGRFLLTRGRSRK